MFDRSGCLMPISLAAAICVSLRQSCAVKRAWPISRLTAPGNSEGIFTSPRGGGRSQRSCAAIGRGPPTICQEEIWGRNPRVCLMEMVPLVASVAPCSVRSRTLRAGSAGAAGGILDRACAALCRAAGRDEGMVAWVEQRNGVMRLPPGARFCSRDRTGSAARARCKADRAGDQQRRAARERGRDRGCAARRSGDG